MKRAPFLLLPFLMVLVNIAPLPAFGEDNTSGERFQRRTRADRALPAGYGGFTISAQSFSSNDLDNFARSMGLPLIGDRMILFGGRGMWHADGRIYLGGEGFGGQARTSGVFAVSDTDGDRLYNRELTIAFGGGGVLIEGVPFAKGPFRLAVGTLLGGGGVTVRFSQDTGAFSFESLQAPFNGDPRDADAENTTVEMGRGFLLAQPYLELSLRPLRWATFSLRGGYNLTTLTTKGWSYNNQEISGKGPEIDLNEPFLQLGLMFGG